MFAQTVTPTARTLSGQRDLAVEALMAEANVGAVTFYPTDSVIYAQGEASGPLYLVEFGTVRICRLTADGRRQINAFHFAGEVFGFEGGELHQCYAESVDGAGIRVLRPQSGETSARKLLNLALRSFAKMQEHLLLLGRMSANQRLATFLLDLLDRQDGQSSIALQMSRNDIADHLGMTFETVSRVLRVMKDKHIVKVVSVDRIEVLDADALADLAY